MYFKIKYLNFHVFIFIALKMLKNKTSRDSGYGPAANDFSKSIFISNKFCLSKKQKDIGPVMGTPSARDLKKSFINTCLPRKLRGRHVFMADFLRTFLVSSH